MILASSLLSTCLLYGFRPDPARIIVCLVTAVCSISLFPIPDGREVLPLWNSAVLLSLFALGLFCGIPADISIAAIIAYSLLVTVHLARLHIKEHHGRLSFGSAAWTGVMNYSRLMCMCVLSALLCLCPVLAPFGWPLWFEVVLLAGFYVFMHVRAYYGRTFLLTEKQAVEIRRPYPVVSASGKTGGQGEAAALRAIYGAQGPFFFLSLPPLNAGGRIWIPISPRTPSPAASEWSGTACRRRWAPAPARLSRNSSMRTGSAMRRR